MCIIDVCIPEPIIEGRQNLHSEVLGLDYMSETNELRRGRESDYTDENKSEYNVL